MLAGGGLTPDVCNTPGVFGLGFLPLGLGLLKRQGHLPGVRGKAFAPGPEDQAFVQADLLLGLGKFFAEILAASLGLLELGLKRCDAYDPCLVPWPKGGQSARIYSSF